MTRRTRRNHTAAFKAKVALAAVKGDRKLAQLAEQITRPNQVWAMDVTYIPMASGFVYLAVVLDWATRRVLSWRLSITMEAAFCVETLKDALARHGRPEIFNTDQGSQFTGSAFTGALASNGIAISMGRSLAGQRVRRAAVAQRQIRGGLARLRNRRRGTQLVSLRWGPSCWVKSIAL